MSNFDFTPSIRRVDDIIIIFRDKHTVVISNARSAVSFHCWFERRQFDYSRSWKPFCQALCRRKHLTLLDCYTLANHHEISFQSYKGDINRLVREVERG